MKFMNLEVVLLKKLNDHFFLCVFIFILVGCLLSLYLGKDIKKTTIDDYLKDDHYASVFFNDDDYIKKNQSLNDLEKASDFIAIVSYKKRIQRSMKFETEVNVDKIIKDKNDMNTSIIHIIESAQIGFDYGLQLNSPMQSILPKEKYIVFLKYRSGFDIPTFTFTDDYFSKFNINENKIKFFLFDMGELFYKDIKSYEFLYSQEDKDHFDENYYNNLKQLAKEINKKYEMDIQINE
jgi:hypothetical protein